MDTGIPVTLKASQVDINIKDCGFDLLIASVGGYPKDINFYQAQKALTNACLFSKPKGVIILAAECRDGFGNKKFEKFMQDKRSWQQIIDCFDNQPFQLGPHKAYLIARQAVDHKIILISNMPDETVHQLLLTPAADIPSALNLAQEHLPSNPRVALLPYATHSLPRT
jgi:nickel-dependent lactate racemase